MLRFTRVLPVLVLFAGGLATGAHADTVLAKAGEWETVMSSGPDKQAHSVRVCRSAVTEANIMSKFAKNMASCPGLQPSRNGQVITVAGNCTQQIGNKPTAVSLQLVVTMVDTTAMNAEFHATYSPPPVAGMDKMDLKLESKYVGECKPGETATE